MFLYDAMFSLQPGSSGDLHQPGRHRFAGGVAGGKQRESEKCLEGFWFSSVKRPGRLC